MRTKLKLFSDILGRIADAVKPLGFKFVQDDPPPSLSVCVRDGFGNRANTFK
jgi:hypothetical protein